MLGPMINPAAPRNQLVGVFSLELARLYAYLYQRSDKRYTILHALEGYDEVSLTCDFKTFSNTGEHIHRIRDLGFERISPETIQGGRTVEESAGIFMEVLNGKSTAEQTNVVLANAALGIRTICPEKSFADCYYEAEDSLLSKRALKCFNSLLDSVD